MLFFTDSVFKHKLIQQNSHIVTSYFNARHINYQNTVLKELFDFQEFWRRSEFAKSRGEIHDHSEFAKSGGQIHDHSEFAKSRGKIHGHSQFAKSRGKIHDHSEFTKSREQIHDHSEFRKSRGQIHDLSEFTKSRGKIQYEKIMDNDTMKNTEKGHMLGKWFQTDSHNEESVFSSMFVSMHHGGGRSVLNGQTKEWIPNKDVGSTRRYTAP